MANISKLLEKIKTAVYGKDMRQSLHDAIKNTNDDLEDFKNAETAARTAEDTTLDGKITAEAEARDDADDGLSLQIANEQKDRMNADNAIANGTRAITPNLAMGTKYKGTSISHGLTMLADISDITPIGYRLNHNFIAHGFNGDYYNGDVSIREDHGEIIVTFAGASVNLDSAAYSGFASLAAIAAAVATLNAGDTTTGSVNKKIKDAIDAFASAITEDGIINTYKEVLDWIATHGADFAALVGQVNTNAGNISTLMSQVNTNTGDITTIRSDVDVLDASTLKQSDKESIISETKNAIIDEIEGDHLTIDVDGGDLDAV